MSLLNTVVADVEKLITSLPPIPEGVYRCQIEALAEKNGTTKAGDAWTGIEVTLKLVDPEQLVAIDRDSAKLFALLFLELREDGSINFDKSLQLNRFLKACALESGESIAECKNRYIDATVALQQREGGVDNRVTAFAAVTE